jgi:tRNA A37 threonylcarbamoyladenosine dehydratase
MVNEEQLLARISDAPWAAIRTVITVGGAGGLGSWLALFLSRVGHSVVSYDFDHVGGENIGGGQMFGPSQIGQEKTSALRKNLNDLCGPTGFIGKSKFSKGDSVTPLCFATFDNMEARKDMFETWMELARNKPEENKDDVFNKIIGEDLRYVPYSFSVDLNLIIHESSD